MLITQIISEYLKTNRRITVAGLGTFLTKANSSTIVFSEFVKEDDGVLRALLISNGLKELEAVAVVDRFVFDMRYALTTEGRAEYLLPRLGRMTFVGGALSFVYDSSVEGSSVGSRSFEVVSQPVVTPVSMPDPTIEIPAPAPMPEIEEPVASADNLFDSFAGYADEGRNLSVGESVNKWWFVLPAIAIVVLLVALFYWLSVEWMYGNIELPNAVDSILRSIFMNESGVPGSSEVQ